MRKKGFIIVIALSFFSAMILAVVSIISMSCGELIQTKTANDRSLACYVAVSGAEKMYNLLKSKEGLTVTWPQAVPAADSTVRTRSSGGTAIGTFSATADTVSAEVLGIVSRGTVNGRSATVTVKYGFNSSYNYGYPLGSIGPMSLSGQRWWILRSWVRAEGPLASGSTVTTNSYARVSGDILQNQAFTPVTFWWKYDPATTPPWTEKIVGDTSSDGNFITDTNHDGQITIADAGGDPAQEAIFQADNINGDSVIDNRDAFISYYTVELNKMGYGIGQGQEHYYSGSQNFGPSSVPTGTPIIFVDGNVDITFNDTEWWGGASDHTIVATGDVNIIQPTNGADDTLTIVSYGNVNTGGVRAFGGIRGNLVVYADGNFNAYYGGRSNGTIFASGSLNVDTVLPIPGLLNRDINKGTEDWSNPANWPIGLPQNYNRVSKDFRIKNEASQYVPIWQRE